MAEDFEYDPDTFAETVTECVRAWLEGDHDEPHGTFLARKYGRWEARKLAMSSDLVADAAAALHGWFADRLTVDPGPPGPFGDLAIDLIIAALGAVDWAALAIEIQAANGEA